MVETSRYVRSLPGRAWRTGFVGVFLLTAFGCSYGITVRQAEGSQLLSAWKASITEEDEVSPRTLQTLRRWDIEDKYRKHPTEAYAQLQQTLVKNPDADLLFAMAELSYLVGRQHEKKDDPGACRYYYLCAAYAYHYLFPQIDNCAQTVNLLGHDPAICEKSCGQGTFESFAYDPRFRVACDLYNTGLAKCIRAAQKIGRLDPRQEIHMPTPDGGGFTLSVVHHGFPWQPDEFGPLLFCGDYDVVGLSNHYRGYGLGVALIGTRTSSSPTWETAEAKKNSSNIKARGSSGGAKPVGRFPHEVSFPVSAFFKFEGCLADLGTRRAGKLELYNPLTVQTVSVHGRSVPLETDLTTPLAYFLSRTDLEGVEYAGFLSADKIKDRTGIYMFEPYQPGKIPVVMVHGLLSSPLTWTTMFNDLRADPRLRDRYQFWFYLYPTGNAYLSAAADLRQELARLRTELDPRGLDRALDHGVLVGHSMGGLVSKMLTVDSGDDFWRLVSAKPFNSLKVGADSRDELQSLFFFAPQPNIQRVIFLATPHHGSKLSPSPPAQLAAKFIKLPKKLMKVSVDVARADPQALQSLRDGQIANSVDLLEPGAPALELLAARPKPPNVHYHSIIGEAYGQGESGSDGVVPYTSAHIAGVDSELVVPASHTVIHNHPRAVLEVWRILMEHLREVDGQERMPESLP